MYLNFFLILDRMADLLPPDKKHVSLSVLPRREPFEILYRLNCDNLCADFHENLEFRFSWGITSMINRFTRGGGNKIAILNNVDRVKTFNFSDIIAQLLN